MSISINESISQQRSSDDGIRIILECRVGVDQCQLALTSGKSHLSVCLNTQALGALMQRCWDKLQVTSR